mgnify:CR=1 FL=1|tara:strand:+ start:579 stop:1136 length:558 start_codon:yes stop_codon:yes gene_type:complete
MSTANLQIEQREALNQLDIKDALGSEVVFREDSVRETKNSNNNFFAGAGSRTGFSLEKPQGVVVLAPGSSVESQVVVSGSSIIRGGTFVCDGNTPAINVTATGKLVLIGAAIVKSENQQTGASDSYISVESGGHISVIGCYFYNAQGNGFVINNAGAAGNCTATGCLDETSRAHNNVTVGVEVAV